MWRSVTLAGLALALSLTACGGAKNTTSRPVTAPPVPTTASTATHASAPKRTRTHTHTTAARPATRTRPQQPPRPHHARPHRPKPAIKRRHAPVPAAKPKPKAAAFKAQTMTTVAITNPNATPAHSAKYNVHSRVCGAALIKAAAAPPNSAPGLTLLGFTLTNTSNSSCRTGGWPQLAFHGAGGKTVAVRVADSSSDMLGATPRRNLELNHGQQASFRISSASSDDSGGGGCPTVQSVSVTLPGDSGHLDVSLQNPEPVCPPAKVSALQPGSGGAGQ